MSVEAIQSPLKELPTSSLCDEIERLTRVERTVAWLLCHHCAELADRFDASDPVLLPFGDISRLAGERFAMRERAVRERVRVGRALRHLPLVHSEFANGRISFAKVREVTRVADRDTEEHWLETARTESVRSLERKVARAKRPEVDAPLAPRVTATRGAGFVDVEMRLPEETWSALLRAMDVARSKSLRPLTDAEALEAVARWAVVSEADPARVSDAAIASCGRVAEGPPAGEAELRFAAELRARLAEQVAAVASRAESKADETTRPGRGGGAAEEAESEHAPGATRPGRADAGAEEEPPSREDGDMLASAPGRLTLSDRCVEAARQIVSAIEVDATNEEAICQKTGLPAGHVASTMTELMLAGIVVRTHRGLALTPWAKRNRFRAVRSKLPH